MKYSILYDKIMYFEDVLENVNEVHNFILNENCKFISSWQVWQKINNYYDNETLKSDIKIYGEKKDIWGSFKQIEIDKRWGPFKKNELNKTWAIDSFSNDINKCAELYKNTFNISLEYNNEQNYLISSYRNNGSGFDLGPHVDVFGNEEDYSLVYYFNDDYSGGEIEFNKQKIKMKPKKNSMLIFPSYQPYEHIAHKSFPSPNYKVYMSHFWKKGPGAGYSPYDQ